MTASTATLSPAPVPVFFDNYTRYPQPLPAWFWLTGRLVALGWGLTLIALLALMPTLGLKLLWGITIPSLPLVLVIAPGLWRQVCPMAFLNQIPRQLGFSRSLDLPERWRNAAFGIAVLVFVVAVSLRIPIFNHEGPMLAAGLLLFLGIAFAGGVVFKGRSGWCGTFCPLGPIQRTYGQAPLMVIPNGYCATCVGCQKSCYDFNPRAAVFADVYDNDPRYAAQRRLFMGMLPGLMAAYFLLVQGPTAALLPYFGLFFGACCVSIGLYWVASSFLPVDPFRISLAFGATALAIFYWFSGPNIVRNIGDLAGFVPSELVLMALRGVGIAAALAMAGSGLVSERQYRRSQHEAAAARTTGSRAALKGRAAANGATEVTDRESGITFDVAADASLLDAVQAAGLKINYGCRSGVCGADAVAVCEGMEHLSPPTTDELATLRRMGLEGRARLACVCQVRGPVVIDRDPHSPAAAHGDRGGAPAPDLGAAAGISRVVIVGNGVAGMGVAEAVRRQSTSAVIEVVTNEAGHFYNRMAIGRLIYSASGMDGLQLLPDNWFQSNKVEVHRNTIASGIDRHKKRLHLATGQALAYDRLVLATGARPMLPAPDFLDRSNAFMLRSADDAMAIRAWVQAHGSRRAVVIGGGVLGIEAADALHHLGLKVILLQRADRLMNAQLDDGAASRLTSYLEGIGIQVVTGVSITRFEGDSLIASAWLSHGPRVRADLYVACLGVEANTYLAEQAGLEIGRGIRVDAAMRTSDPDIYAVGDVAEIRGGPAGLWPICAAQATVAAAAMLGQEASFEPPRIVLQLKCDGIDLRAFGNPFPQPGDEICTSHPEDIAYWRFVLRNGETVGAVYVGPPGSSRHITRVLQNGISLNPVLEQLRQGNLAGLKDL